MRPAASVVTLLLLATPTAVAARPAARPAPAVAPAADVRIVTLRNGVRLLLAPDAGANAVDVGIWFPRRERAGAAGISHLLEGLLSGPGADPREPDLRVQAEGGSAAAFTRPDLLCAQVTVPPAALDLALRLQADRIAAFGAGEAALERRRQDLAQERRRRAEAMPLARAVESLQGLAWSAGPYHWPVLGLEADLARIGLAECRAWHRDHLGPKGALVTVVGSFDPERALQSARRWLEPIPSRRAVVEPADAGAAQRSERRAAEPMPLPARVLAVGWRTPASADPDGPALALLSRILTSGPSARLQAALAADPLRCLAVQGLLDARRDEGLLCALAVVRPAADSAAVERAMIAEAERLAREPVAPEELERARRQEMLATLAGWQGVRGRADALGTALLLDGDWNAAATRLERVRTLTPEDLRRAAARVFTAANRCVLWALPGTAPEAARGVTGAALPNQEGGR